MPTQRPGGGLSSAVGPRHRGKETRARLLLAALNMAAALESEVKAIESEVKAVVNKVKEKETLAATSGRRADGLFSHATR